MAQHWATNRVAGTVRRRTEWVVGMVVQARVPTSGGYGSVAWTDGAAVTEPTSAVQDGGMALAVQSVLPAVDGGALSRAARLLRRREQAATRKATRVAANGPVVGSRDRELVTAPVSAHTSGMWGEASYPALQARCKALGLRAVGTRALLLERLAEYDRLAD